MVVRKKAAPAAKRWAALLVCALLAAGAFLPGARALESAKTVRVGWYESPFNTTDQFGRRSGYAYEYQRKIAAYTGWNYEYVEGSWAELMQMLVTGEIDLMSDVSYLPEREEQMLYSDMPMGSQEYYLFTTPENTEIQQDTPASLNGKRIGVTKGSIQSRLYYDWAEKHGIQAELVELTNSEETSLQMMQRGELDAHLTLDVYGNINEAVPKMKIGSSDFYFALNKKRTDLWEELNAAMSRIQNENRYFNQQLSQKYISFTGASLFLSEEEQNWLSGHGPIRVGYQDNFLAFCAADERTGALTGALKDYLDDAANCLENAQLEFQPVAYPTASAAFEALQKGEVDCVFPSNLSTSDGEGQGLVLTPPMMRTEIYAVVRKADRDSFSQKQQVTAAVRENDPNETAVLRDHFPDWQAVPCPDIEACIQAVGSGKADCLMISNYQYNDLSDLCQRYRLTQLATGEDADLCIAVKERDQELYSILTRTTNLVSSTSVNGALTYYSSQEQKSSFASFVRDNPAIVVSVVVVILAMAAVVFIQHRLILAQRRAAESQRMVESLNKKVFVDALTHVRNKGGFDDYLQGLQKRLDKGELREVAIGVFDCNNLKLINDQYGHDKGNQYLLASSQLICTVFQHSPVFRIGGDEFTAVLLGEDFQNREALARQFEDVQAEMSKASNRLSALSPFSSRKRLIWSSLTRSSSSSRVGTSSSAPLPVVSLMRSSLISDRVISPGFLSTPVRRPKVLSWLMMYAPSLVRWVSVSPAYTPSWEETSRPSREFSEAMTPPVRWATSLGICGP